METENFEQEAVNVFSKEFDDLDFTDDFMFCNTLVNNPELCKELAELIIGRKISKIIKVQDQQAVKVTSDGKGVRFDVTLEGENEICDIEMQNNIDRKVLPKRSRYYQSVADVNMLVKGKVYTNLKKSYILFICRSNPFKENDLHKYTFRNICVERPSLELGDETEKIFLTPDGTAEDISKEMTDFMAYMTDKKTDSDFARRLDDAVKAIKSGEGWRIEYMQLKEKMDENFKAGEKKGREKERESGVNILIESCIEDGLPVEVIIKKLVSKYGFTKKEASERIKQFR